MVPNAKMAVYTRNEVVIGRIRGRSRCSPLLRQFHVVEQREDWGPHNVSTTVQ
jgi:hypothetical protein